MDSDLEEYFETEKQIIIVLETALAKGKLRKVEDFVDDMVRRNRTLTHVLAVAFNTRWFNQKEKIKLYYANRILNHK